MDKTSEIWLKPPWELISSLKMILFYLCQALIPRKKVKVAGNLARKCLCAISQTLSVLRNHLSTSGSFVVTIDKIWIKALMDKKLEQKDLVGSYDYL